MSLTKLRKKYLSFDFLNSHAIIGYTIFFLLMTLIVFHPFWLFEKNFILHSRDASAQHYPALIYLGQWLRRIARNFLSGNFSVPLWDFSIGYGADAITTFNYYSLGDPLNLIAVFVPTEYTEYLFTFLVILRMYISGLGFYFLTKYFKINKNVCVITALLYAFNFFNLRSGTMHIFFLNASMYLPFVILGAEKIFRNEKPFLFVISVFCFTICNFYFAYTLILITVIYVLVRFFCSKTPKKISCFLKVIGKFLAFGLIGIMLSAFILLPIVTGFLSNSRTSASQDISLLYNFQYYRRFFTDFLGTYSGEWHTFGYTPIGLLGVFYLFINKNKFKTQKVLFVCFTIFLLFPIFGYVFNGFVYPTNRFCYAYHLLITFITAYTFKDIICLNRKQKEKLAGITLGYMTLSLVFGDISQDSTYVQFILLLLILFVLCAGYLIFRENGMRKIKVSIAVLSILSIITTSVFYFSPFKSNRLSDYTNTSNMHKKYTRTSNAFYKDRVKADEDFYRLQTETKERHNASVVSRTNGTGFYFSFCTDSLPEFYTEMEMVRFTPYMYFGVGKSAFLGALASVKYYSVNTNERSEYQPPYGYNILSEDKGYNLYINENTLPIGYTYNAYLTRDEFDKLSAVEKREAIIQNVLLDEDISGFNKNKYEINSEKASYDIKYSKDITVKNNGFYVKKNNSKITITFEGRENCETYISIDNFKGEYMDEYELLKTLPNEYKNSTQNDTALNKVMNLYDHLNASDVQSFDIDLTSDKSTESITLCTDDYKFYNGIHNYTLNMGYSEEPQKTITLNFPNTGFFSWDNLEITYQSLENYNSYVETLSQDVLENVVIDDNYISGSIKLDNPKILCLSVPNSKGWKAFVDGKETEIMSANIWSMALSLGEGEHTVELRYSTPGLKIGLIFSALGVFIMSILIFIYKKYSLVGGSLICNDKNYK